MKIFIPTNSPPRIIEVSNNVFRVTLRECRRNLGWDIILSSSIKPWVKNHFPSIIFSLIK